VTTEADWADDLMGIVFIGGCSVLFLVYVAYLVIVLLG
jgi:hypothetical protein